MILDLSDEVILNIIVFMEDFLPLKKTCKRLCGIINSEYVHPVLYSDRLEKPTTIPFRVHKVIGGPTIGLILNKENVRNIELINSFELLKMPRTNVVLRDLQHLDCLTVNESVPIEFKGDVPKTIKICKSLHYFNKPNTIYKGVKTLIVHNVYFAETTKFNKIFPDLEELILDGCSFPASDYSEGSISSALILVNVINIKSLKYIAPKDKYNISNGIMSSSFRRLLNYNISVIKVEKLHIETPILSKETFLAITRLKALKHLTLKTNEENIDPTMLFDMPKLEELTLDCKSPLFNTVILEHVNCDTLNKLDIKLRSRLVRPCSINNVKSLTVRCDEMLDLKYIESSFCNYDNLEYITIQSIPKKCLLEMLSCLPKLKLVKIMVDMKIFRFMYTVLKHHTVVKGVPVSIKTFV
jgi:hypothetical protein